jgi:hypothetical protein
MLPPSLGSVTFGTDVDGSGTVGTFPAASDVTCEYAVECPNSGESVRITAMSFGANTGRIIIKQLGSQEIAHHEILTPTTLASLPSGALDTFEQKVGITFSTFTPGGAGFSMTAQCVGRKREPDHRCSPRSRSWRFER